MDRKKIKDIAWTALAVVLGLIGGGMVAWVIVYLTGMIE